MHLTIRRWNSPNAFFSLYVLLVVLSAFTFHSTTASAGLVISEFMAINNSVLRDEDGAYSDWIELYNSGSNTVSLAGWHLSNKSTNLTQWTFPATNLAPHGFLVVFASNKNRSIAGAELHTNFKLSGSGEYLALVMPDGITKATEFAPAFPPQFPDVSFGFVMASSTDSILSGTPAYLSPPTPGAWNNSASSPALPGSVSFWPPPGVYTSNSLNVGLTASASAQAIYYTLDGSVPTATSRVYSNSIYLPTNATIRARAQSGGILGPLTAANYLLLDSTVTNFSSNLPLIIVDTLGQTIPDGSKIGAYGIFIPTNSLSGRARLAGPGDYVGRLGIGLHGSSSLMFPKQPFAVELDDENGDPVNYPLLSFPSGNDWLLYPSYDDKTFLNNVLTEEIFRSMGHYAVRCQFAELFLRSIRGKINRTDYQGIYIVIERIRVDTNRVDIADLKPSDATPPAVTGGYIISKDKITPDNVLFTTTSGEQLIVNHPTPDALTSVQSDYISNYVNELEAALYGPNWSDPLLGYAAFIDPDSCVDYHWIVEYSKNIDGISISDYMTKDRSGRLRMEPIWDWDLSWGNANYGEGGITNNWHYTLLGDLDDIWLRRLRADPDFYQRIIDRWGALRSTVFKPSNLFARIDQYTNYIWEAQARDFVRWPRLGTYVWPNPNGAAGGWDVDFVTPTNYSGIIAQFKKFILGRYLWIDQQFVPAPVLLTDRAQLSINALVGAIYYTLDGTDPRAGGGALSTSALRYSGSVMLTSNAAIFARAFSTNAWSSPAQALFISELPSLRITEINYHPLPGPTNAPYTDKDYEFVEVQNTGTNTIDLSGARIGGGINFTFRPNRLGPVGTPTTNDFDLPGTAFTASTLARSPGPFVTNQAPGGHLLRLLNSDTNLSRNRITFDQTATGACDRVTLDFDFRTSSSAVATNPAISLFQDFDSSGTPYTLSSNGSATPAMVPAGPGSSGNFLRLVPAAGGQLATIAFPTVAPGTYNSIVASFDLRITPPPGATPADGFAFALLSTAAFGTTGAGPFFYEEPNLAGSLAVGFDVYNNASTPQEPNNNHISLHWNGAQIGNAVTPSFSMSNGKFHRAQVIVSFSGNNAYVTVRLTPDINGGGGPTETVLENALITGVTPYQSRVAFGARTGGAWASHDLDNINVAFSQGGTATAGLSVLLLPTTQFGSTGRGTTLATFTDFPLVSNTLSFDLSFNPSGLFNDASLYWDRTLVASFPLPRSAVDLNAGGFHHSRIQLESTNSRVLVNWTITPSEGQGTPTTVCSNLPIFGTTLANKRLELAARNGNLVSTIDVDNVSATSESWLPLLLAPGADIVVVHNLAAFTSRYGTNLPVAGEFSGSLSNQGDELTLFGPLGEPILDFRYDPTWYPSTDGGGFSLVAVNPNADPANWGLPGNWRPSGELNGSPGAPDLSGAVPILTIALDAPNAQLTLSWPAVATQFDLHRAATLGSQAQWNILTNSPVLNGDHWTVALPIQEAGWFYRLQQR